MNALFRNVLTASFHGSIVILAVLLLRLLLWKAAPKKYLCYLWVLAGLRLLMPFDIQSQFSLQPQSPVIIRWEQPASFYPREEPVKQPRQTLSDITASNTHPDMESKDTVSEELLLSSRVLPEEEAGSASLSDVKTASVFFLPLFWAAAALAFFGYNLYCYQSLRKKVRNAREIPGGWESDGIETAFILGFIRPQIYIPTQTPTQDRGYILAHERTHLDKGDHWIKMLGFLTLAIHWFNPLVWAAYILLCKDIEMACDERVVQFMELQERKEYSTALLNCSSSHVHHAASPVAFGEVNVKNRIQSILAYRNPSFWGGFLSAMAVVFVTVCFVTNPIASGDGLKSSSKAFTLATQPPMEEASEWGVTILPEATSSSTLRLYYGLDSRDDVPVEVIWDSLYRLDVWNGKSWEALPLQEDAPPFRGTADNTVLLSADYYPSDVLEILPYYGKLPEGDYRVCVPVTRQGETKDHYAWFHIYANALTGDEAEAFAKVEAALYRLSNSQNYMAAISDSSRQGVVLPTASIRVNGSSAQIDYYTGDYCYASYPCSPKDTLVTAWLDSFYPGDNAYISFAGKDGKISGNEISFTSSWVDVLGKVSSRTHTYQLNDLGQLTGVTLLTQSTDDEGVVTKSQRTLSVEYDGSYHVDSILTAKDAYTAVRESPWNLYFVVEDDSLTASGGEVSFRLGDGHIGVSHYTTDGSFWLEKYDPNAYEDRHWQALLTKADSPSWGGGIYRVRNRATTQVVDWTSWYGELSPGLYRMGKRFYDGSESITQYAEFLVYPSGAVLGNGGEAAMARIRAAVDKACAGSYCVKSTNYTNQPLSGGEYNEYVFWKWNGICVTDAMNYADASLVRRPPVREEDARYVDLENNYNPDLFYDRWARALPWNQPNFRIYFPQGDSVISDGEISFTGAYFRDAYSMAHYSVFFDGDGNLTSIVTQSGGSRGTTYTSVLSFEDVPEEEIRAVVEEALDKEAQSEGGAL